MDAIGKSVVRDKNIDCIKGLAIFFVIWGHTIQVYSNGNIDFFEDTAFKFIYSFHMPLFMIVSGYLFYGSLKKKNVIEVLIKKFRGLILPSIVWGCVSFALNYLYNMYMGLKVQNDFSFLWSCVTNYWFLWAVFNCVILVALVSSVVRINILQEVCFLLCMPIILFMQMAEHTLYMYPYFVVGFIYAKYKENTKFLKFSNAIRCIGTLIYPYLLLNYKKMHYIYISGVVIHNSEYGLGQIPIDIFRWIIGFSGIAFILFFINIINELRCIKVSGMLEKLGRRSLELYIIQTITLEFFGRRIFNDIISSHISIQNNMMLFDIFITPMVAIFYVIVNYWIISLLSKNKITSKILFGRNVC